MFSELLAKGSWTAKSLSEWALHQEKHLQDYISGWNETRNTYRNFGKILKPNPRHEALYINLTNEIVTREIGLAGTELKGIEKFLTLVEKFHEEIKICDFDEFVKQNDVPSKYCLLLKMDFQEGSSQRT